MPIDEEFVIKSFSEHDTVSYYANAVEEIGLWQSEQAIYSKYFKPSDKILDIGCGAGRTTISLYRQGFKRIEGIDLSPAMIATAKDLQRRIGFKITFTVGSACRLAHTDESFDGAIFSFNGLMQIPQYANRRRAVDEVRRVLRQDGFFIFTAIHREPRYRFWRQQRKVWAQGVQDSRLIEYGDVIIRERDGKREGYLHFPTMAEVTALIRQSGLRLIERTNRQEICRDSEAANQFAGDCTFWVARK
jgi:ubiquinone/menaquinone biosynthesis C-methylase UbiE